MRAREQELAEYWYNRPSIMNNRNATGIHSSSVTSCAVSARYLPCAKGQFVKRVRSPQYNTQKTYDSVICIQWTAFGLRCQVCPLHMLYLTHTDAIAMLGNDLR